MKGRKYGGRHKFLILKQDRMGRCSPKDASCMNGPVRSRIKLQRCTSCIRREMATFFAMSRTNHQLLQVLVVVRSRRQFVSEPSTLGKQPVRGSIHGTLKSINKNLPSSTPSNDEISDRFEPKNTQRTVLEEMKVTTGTDHFPP